MNLVVHLTEAESEAQQAADLVVHLASHSDPAYVAGTTRWDNPKERLDGKWTTVVHPEVDYTGKTVVTYDASDYPILEEI